MQDNRHPDMIELTRKLNQRRLDDAIEIEWRQRIKRNLLQREVNRRHLANLS